MISPAGTTDGCRNPIIGGGGALIYPAIHSPNFQQSPLTGWSVNKDGSAFFGNLTLSGTFNGNNWILNSSGFFIYSGIPAFGNLIESHTPAAGTDGFGNAYLAGASNYQTSPTFLASNVNAGSIVWYTAPGAGGPWTAGASIQSSIIGGSNLFLAAGNQTALGNSANCAWLDGVQNFILPAGGGPFISGESFHTITLNGSLSGRIRVKKLPWNAIWCDISVTVSVAGTSFLCGSLPDATYYPTTSLALALGNTNVIQSWLFVPTSGALNVRQGSSNSGATLSGQFIWPTN